MNNPIFQELPDKDKYFSVTHDNRMYLDLRATSGYLKEAEKLERNDPEINLNILLKAAATYKLRVSGLTLKHRTYASNQSDDNFLERREGNNM